MDPKEARRNDRYAQLALAATHHALMIRDYPEMT